jgi:hypothetical protein
MSQGHMTMPMHQQQQNQHHQQQQQQQQSYYNVGASPYYDFTNGGLGGYPGM